MEKIPNVPKKPKAEIRKEAYGAVFGGGALIGLVILITIAAVVDAVSRYLP